MKRVSLLLLVLGAVFMTSCNFFGFIPEDVSGYWIGAMYEDGGYSYRLQLTLDQDYFDVSGSANVADGENSLWPYTVTGEISDDGQILLTLSDEAYGADDITLLGEVSDFGLQFYGQWYQGDDDSYAPYAGTFIVELQ